MSPIRFLNAALTLAVFFGAGWVVPALHQATHGTEHTHTLHAAAPAGHVHADGASLTVPPSGLDDPDDLCALCLPAPTVTAAAGAVPSPRVAAQSFALLHAGEAAAPARAFRPIRGPPAVA
ncbi:MAG: hypothetical protein AAGI91_13785 [Bacteroidota bacterium]